MAQQPVPTNSFVSEFQAAFAPTSTVAYLSEELSKRPFQKEKLLESLHLAAADPQLAPSAVLYDTAQHWLFLIETVPAHGPITLARRQQLATWAQACTAHKVFVTAFPDMATYQALGADIAWETDVWLADAPQHLIHFNGDRFMGPR